MFQVKSDCDIDLDTKVVTLYTFLVHVTTYQGDKIKTQHSMWKTRNHCSAFLQALDTQRNENQLEVDQWIFVPLHTPTPALQHSQNQPEWLFLVRFNCLSYGFGSFSEATSAM